jgi:hypothetical protein
LKVLLRPVRISFAFILAAFLISCGGEKATIVPKIQINKRSAEMGTPVEVTFSFSTKGDYVAMQKDLTVFCHFRDPKKKIRFQDDHQPPIKTNEWRPGHNYNYTRTIFIPKNIPPGEYSVMAGLYTPGKGERIPLEAKADGNRYYKMGSIVIEIPQQDTLIQFAKGWYDPETDSADVSKQWRWAGKEAVMKVRNPQSDALLYLKADGTPEKFTEPQQVKISVGDHVVDTFLLTSNMPFMKKYNIAKNLLGTDKTLEVKVSVDKTFIPAEDKASSDHRELGIRIYELYLGKAAD